MSALNGFGLPPEQEPQRARYATPQAPPPSTPRAVHDPRGPMLDLLRESAAWVWQQRANCRGLDPEMFFPERGASTSEAKAVCSACDVRSECLEYALASNIAEGIWGGESARERRAIKRRRALDRRRRAS